MKRVGDEATIELGFGSTAYIELGMAGFFGLLPATSWLFSLGIGLFGESKTSSSGVLGLLAVVVTILGILAAPWALPAVLLRARQWSGARIAIEEDAVVEYDGA